MRRLFNRQRVPRDVAERLRVAAALAAEQVIEEHVSSALELIAEGAGRAPVERLLAAYSRLHHLGNGQDRQLRDRVFASLGRDHDTLGRHPELGAPRSPLRRIKRRLRGRIHLELRHWIERHTARVELELIELHVHHGMEFVRILAEHASLDQAIAAYADALGLRGSVAEVVRLKVLQAFHDLEDADVEPLHPRPTTLPLRIADHGG